MLCGTHNLMQSNWNLELSPCHLQPQSCLYPQPGTRLSISLLPTLQQHASQVLRSPGQIARILVSLSAVHPGPNLISSFQQHCPFPLAILQPGASALLTNKPSHGHSPAPTPPLPTSVHLPNTLRRKLIHRRPRLPWPDALTDLLLSQTSFHFVAQPILELILWSRLSLSVWQSSWPCLQVLLTCPISKFKLFPDTLCPLHRILFTLLTPYLLQASLTQCGLIDPPWNSVRSPSFSLSFCGLLTSL